MRQFSDAALEWLRTYHGSIDATALLMAYDAGQADAEAWGASRNFTVAGDGA